MPGRKNMQHQDHEITDMTGYSILNEKPSIEKLIAPCSARKRKLLNIENAAMQQIEVSHDQSFGAKKSYRFYSCFAKMEVSCYL